MKREAFYRCHVAAAMPVATTTVTWRSFEAFSSLAASDVRCALLHAPAPRLSMRRSVRRESCGCCCNMQTVTVPLCRSVTRRSLRGSAHDEHHGRAARLESARPVRRIVRAWRQRLLFRDRSVHDLPRALAPARVAGLSGCLRVPLVPHEFDRAAVFRRVYGSARALVVFARRDRADGRRGERRGDDDGAAPARGVYRRRRIRFGADASRGRQIFRDAQRRTPRERHLDLPGRRPSRLCARAGGDRAVVRALRNGRRGLAVRAGSDCRRLLVRGNAPRRSFRRTVSCERSREIRRGGRTRRSRGRFALAREHGAPPLRLGGVHDVPAEFARGARFVDSRSRSDRDGVPADFVRGIARCRIASVPYAFQSWRS